MVTEETDSDELTVDEASGASVELCSSVVDVSDKPEDSSKLVDPASDESDISILLEETDILISDEEFDGSSILLSAAEPPEL